MKVIKLVFLLSQAFLFVSCNKNFTKLPLIIRKNKEIPTLQQLNPIIINKDSVITIVSISSVERYLFDKNVKWIHQSKVVSNFKKSTFNIILNNINKITITKKYPIDYSGSNKNDSLYKSIMNYSFTSSYNHLMMQDIDFSKMKQNGIYLFVTYLRQDILGVGGGGASRGGGGGVGSNTLYEFFNVQNGKVIAYSGYSLGRDDSWKAQKNKGFPKYKELLWVIKRLYKKSANQQKKELDKE